MIKIVSIWWWNGQSNLLNGINPFLKSDYYIVSIVSMSDNGRSTGRLMKVFERDLWLYLAPPWDLRRCIISQSSSKYKSDFSTLFESKINLAWDICDYTFYDILDSFSLDLDFLNFIKLKFWDYLDLKLDLKDDISEHKFWNIFMALVYYRLWDYYKMLSVFKFALEVKGDILAVTCDKAQIEAITECKKTISWQDSISNNVEYDTRIKDMYLDNESKNASIWKDVEKTLFEADYIIVWPGDIYTSIISNFIVWWFREALSKTSAKIIYISNISNKHWESKDFSSMDFVYLIEKYMWKTPDFILSNNKVFSQRDISFFKSNNEKLWEFVYFSQGDKKELQSMWIKLIEDDFTYKYDILIHDRYVLAKNLFYIFD